MADDKPKRVQARREIGDLGQMMERRLRAKDEAVERGDMIHWRQAKLADLFERARVNLMELKACAGISDAGTGALSGSFGPEAAPQKAADLSNLVNLIRLRVESEAAQD